METASQTPPKKSGKSSLLFSNSGKFKKKKAISSPYDLTEICKKFIVPCSNKDLVREIGLIASNGIASFVSAPSYSPSLDPSLMICLSKQGGGGLDLSAPNHSTLDVVLVQSILTSMLLWVLRIQWSTHAFPLHILLS
jgi:hypothetical protein